MNIKIFMDGAKLEDMLMMKNEKIVSGFTTNPTLMRKVGITNFEEYCKKILVEIKNLPISFEVFADDHSEMARQAQIISSWGSNVYVKIPISNSKGFPSIPLIRDLSDAGVKINVTAIMTKKQVNEVVAVINENTPTLVSVFAGRIADTGLDPIPIMQECLKIVRKKKNAELLWASPREVLNLYQADQIGCDIITMTPELISKISLGGKSLEEFSLETVNMFYNDAVKSGFKL